MTTLLLRRAPRLALFVMIGTVWLGLLIAIGAAVMLVAWRVGRA